MSPLVQRFVPARCCDEGEQERHAALLVVLVFVTTGFSVFYFAVSAWVRHPPGMAAMAWNAIGFLSLLPMLRAGLSLRAAGNAFAFVAAVGIGVCVAFQGGLASPVLPWFVFPALMGLMLVGPRSGMAWTAICALAVCVFGGLALGGLELPVVVDPARRAVLDISAPAGLVLIVFSVALALETGRRAEADRVRQRNAQLASALDELERTQDQLIRSEKLASLSTVTAGVAHEIKNPLNFVNNFAALSVDLVEEIRAALDTDPDRPCCEARDEASDALADLETNVQKIAEHGRRADAIVRAMLLTARGSSSAPEPTDLNALVTTTADQALSGWLARHGGPPPALDLALGEDVGSPPLSRLDVERALTNLLSNAFDAVQERAQAGDSRVEPLVRVTTQRDGDAVEVQVIDNGVGIAEAVRDRAFEPFYTTKPTGTGTGLGLALVHEVVVHRHGGDVELRPLTEGTAAVVRLPSPPRATQPAGARPVSRSAHS